MTTKHKTHEEIHRIDRVSWLRAAVLGANDGIVSTASLLAGVAAAGATSETLMMTGTAGLVAGAMSMAAGEYVSVQAQADTENADLGIERAALVDYPEGELEELVDIYRGRGLTDDLARQVAVQLTEHDALGAHARDELGITDEGRARPIQAALSSAVAFALGAAMPLLAAILMPKHQAAASAIATSLVALAFLGVISAWTGGAPIARSTFRIIFWGGLAMGLTFAVGSLFGVAVA